jgi:DNA repair protein RecN (Recombination protein N)
MLVALSIRDIVLIDHLDLEFGPGLCVLSGETGAGKSILLDSLALALGARGDAGLVRHGSKQGSVTAVFTHCNIEQIRCVLDEQELEIADDELVLRRIQFADGRTRGFFNDQPIGIRLMQKIGRNLVEIHGQHEERALLEPSSHLALIDAFGDLKQPLAEVSRCWHHWREAKDKLNAHKKEVSQALAEYDYLKHVHEELVQIAPLVGEEEQLAQDRALMMAGEQIVADLDECERHLFSDGGADGKVSEAISAIERGRVDATDLLSELMEAISRCRAELDDVRRIITGVQQRSQFDTVRLEETEERLFALRAAARKHNVSVDDLVTTKQVFADKLASIKSSDDLLDNLGEALQQAQGHYLAAAADLSSCRYKVAGKFDEAVVGKLGPLRLAEAHFVSLIEQLAIDNATERGTDRVQFMLASNKGAPPGPLSKVISGGELSRVMLAVKVVLASCGGAPTLIFDEIDSGVGGAVADAVGQCLSALSGQFQVLVVTHSPQVAARAGDHLLIRKLPGRGEIEMPCTQVLRLSSGDRCEEIARMLAGAEVTDEARAAAGRLISGVSS